VRYFAILACSLLMLIMPVSAKESRETYQYGQKIELEYDQAALSEYTQSLSYIGYNTTSKVVSFLVEYKDENENGDSYFLHVKVGEQQDLVVSRSTTEDEDEKTVHVHVVRFTVLGVGQDRKVSIKKDIIEVTFQEK
jgi:hypothetical protein